MHTVLFLVRCTAKVSMHAYPPLQAKHSLGSDDRHSAPIHGLVLCVFRFYLTDAVSTQQARLVADFDRVGQPNDPHAPTGWYRESAKPVSDMVRNYGHLKPVFISEWLRLFLFKHYRVLFEGHNRH